MYIMFIAVLSLIWRSLRKAQEFHIRISDLCCPYFNGYPVCYYLLHYSLLTSILTASMFATHTLVAYPIVNKFGIAKMKQ
ncbi:hypothetical protein CS542_02920 [Pedobacter sp. IW39]|nr:hypothetical protein CS542_02920 [Pedobacter sp. IW39]